MKAVSIILPVYNVENYIAKCINSIIDQSFKDFELIIIDDCGDDNSISISKDILVNFKTDYKIISNQTNKGLSQSRNIGIESSMSDYILCIDSDDWIDPFMLEKMYYAAIKHGADLVSCNAMEYWATSKALTNLFKMKGGAYNSDDYLETLFSCNTNIVSVAWAKLIKKELFKKIKFPEKVTFEDILTIPYIIKEAKTIIHLEDPLYYYVKRISNTSITDTKPANIEGFLYYLKKLKNDSEFKFKLHALNSKRFAYKNLLLITYSCVSFSKRHSEIASELKSISSFIDFKDLLTLKRIMRIKHIIYLILLKTNTQLFYSSFKLISSLNRLKTVII